MIRLEGITTSFGSLEVLKGIDLEINKGEIVSIVGPSGAGKTTLLQIMGTLDRPDKGRVIYDGQDVSRLGDARLSAFRNANIGFIFQFHQLLPEFTALENVMIPAFIAARPVAEAKRRAMELLKFMGLSACRAQARPALWRRAAACRRGTRLDELAGGHPRRRTVGQSRLEEQGGAAPHLLPPARADGPNLRHRHT